MIIVIIPVGVDVGLRIASGYWRLGVSLVILSNYCVILIENLVRNQLRVQDVVITK